MRKSFTLLQANTDSESSYATESSFSSSASSAGGGAGVPDDVSVADSTKSADEKAKEILRDNAEIRGVHSKESLKKIMEKAEKIAAAMEELRNMPTSLNPVIRQSDDTMPVKLSFDPSKIAYLYRSPAI